MPTYKIATSTDGYIHANRNYLQKNKIKRSYEARKSDVGPFDFDLHHLHIVPFSIVTFKYFVIHLFQGVGTHK